MTDVTLVSVDGVEIGSMEKIEAHERGLMHRAVSVFVFRPDGRLILQQRAQGKYHSGGTWANTCCGHPEPGESAKEAAVRRLKEEMGLVCELSEVGTFSYRATFDNGLIENEFDHVFVGISQQSPSVDPKEAQAWREVLPSKLALELEASPERFAFWFPLALRVVEKSDHGRAQYTGVDA